MKNIVLIFTLLVSAGILPSAYAEWTKVSKNRKATYYIDFNKVREVDGYLFYWILGDYPKRTKNGDLSGMAYQQTDCKLFRYKVIHVKFYKEPMGNLGDRDSIKHHVPNGDEAEWEYPDPRSSVEHTLRTVCDFEYSQKLE